MNPVLAVERLVGRVRRRLFAQTLLNHLLWCLAAAFLAVAVWFVLQSVILPDVSRLLVWSVAASLIACGLLTAGVLAWLRRPTRVVSALTLDEKFALKECVTTVLALSESDKQSPAGSALLADIQQRVEKLDLGGKFPMRLSWTTCFAPMCALILAAVAYISEPSWSFGNSAQNKGNKQVTLSKDAQSKLESLKTLPVQKRELDPEDAEKLKELEDAWKKLIEKPQPKTAEEVRERVREIRNLEERLKERTREMQKEADKESELKALLNKLANLDAKDKKPKEGAIRDFEEALSQGKFDKAEEIIDKLQKKLKNKELSQKEQQELARQLAELEQKLRQLLDPRDLENMKELEELAKLLGECKDCLANELDGELSAEKLRELMKNLKELKKMQLTKEQLKELLECQGNCQNAREALLLTLNRRNGMGGGGPPGGRRPVGEEPKDSKIKNERQTGQINPDGQLRVTGFSRGGSFSKIPAREVGGAFKQAVQEAPEAIERQQIPPDAADIAKGYFQKLGGQ